MTHPDTRRIVAGIARHTLRVSLLSYLGYYALETVAPGFLSLYVPDSPLFYGVLGSGLTALLLEPAPRAVSVAPPRSAHSDAQAVGLALGGALVVWLSTRDLGNAGVVLAGASGLLILTVSLLLYGDGIESPN